MSLISENKKFEAEVRDFVKNVATSKTDSFKGSQNSFKTDTLGSSTEVEVWLDVATVATLLQSSKRTIQREVKKGTYSYKIDETDDRKPYLIKLSSLKPEAQERYKEILRCVQNDDEEKKDLFTTVCLSNGAIVNGSRVPCELSPAPSCQGNEPKICPDISLGYVANSTENPVDLQEGVLCNPLDPPVSFENNSNTIINTDKLLSNDKNIYNNTDKLAILQGQNQIINTSLNSCEPSAPFSLENNAVTIPEEAKKVALARYDLIKKWDNYIKNSCGNFCGNKSIQQNAAGICVLVQKERVDGAVIETLLNISKDTILRKIQNGELKAVKVKSPGRQGWKHLIYVSSLPLDAQIKYFYEYFGNDNEILRGAQDDVRPTKKQVNAQFLALYNARYWSDLYKLLGNVSLQTLYRWKKAIKCNNDWRELLPGYNYQSSKKLNTTLSKTEQETFLDIILRPSKFDVATARNWTEIILRGRGYEEVASYAAYRRFVEHYKKFNKDVWVLSREGQKVLRDKVIPYIQRDASMLNVGDLLVADGHVLDFQVINPFTGKPCRAVIVGFQDWKSGAIAGYEIMVTENTQSVCSALRNSIINLGCIPKYVLLDNGTSFKNKFFKGCKDFEEAGFRGVYASLGITTIFAKPYNARAKKIEPFFKVFTNTFEKVLPSYIGNNIENKPAYLMRNEKLHKAEHKKNEFIPTIEQATVMINWWIENYYNKRECILEKGKTIGEVFAIGRGSGVDISKLDDLLMAQEIKTIRRNGIRFLGSDYWSEKLYGFNDRVIVRYSLFDLSEIKVYSLRNEYICTAKTIKECHVLANYLGNEFDQESLKQANKKQKELEKETIQKLTGTKRSRRSSSDKSKLEWGKTALIGADLKAVKKQRAEKKKVYLWACERQQKEGIN